MFPVLVLLSLVLIAVRPCPPQPNGNCYAGSYISGQHSIVNQRCSADPFQDWCAVTYQPAAGVANFGCANNFQPPLGLPKCGLGIEKQGCNTVQTASGPCLLCCCKGGSCNHPQMTKISHIHTKFGSTSGLQSDWKNVYVVSAFSFLDAFQFSFFVYSFWPYVQQLDSTTSASVVGIIMAVSGLGEALFAPLLGYWSTRTGNVLPPLLFSVVLSIIGNLLYMTLNGVPLAYRTIALLISRFLNGAGSGNRGTYFSYISAATTTEDRTRAMALAGGGALIGLNIGPAVQMAFTWIGEEGLELGFMRFSAYTTPAVLAILINIICIGILVFGLDDGLDRFNPPDADTQSAYSIALDSDCDLERNVVTTIRVDVLAVAVCMFARAARMMMTTNIESIGSPFGEVMFGLQRTEVLSYNSYMQAAVGFLTTLMLIVYVFTNFTKWISERLNCLWAMCALLFFHVLTFSWPFLPGQIDHCDRFNGPGSSQNWSWCYDLKPVNIWLFYISYSLIFGISLPCLNNSLQSLFSQVLGKGRQGLLQGINQSVGCFSRILAPVLMSSAFSAYGPQATWLLEMGLISLCVVIWCSFWRRIKAPPVIKQREISLSSEQDGVVNPACNSSLNSEQTN